MADAGLLALALVVAPVAWSIVGAVDGPLVVGTRITGLRRDARHGDDPHGADPPRDRDPLRGRRSAPAERRRTYHRRGRAHGGTVSPEMVTLADRVVVMRDLAVAGELVDDHDHESVSQAVIRLIHVEEGAAA